MGGYFFFVSRMISIIKLMRLTMKVQNWNNSENVTKSATPFPFGLGAREVTP